MSKAIAALEAAWDEANARFLDATEAIQQGVDNVERLRRELKEAEEDRLAASREQRQARDEMNEIAWAKGYLRDGQKGEPSAAQQLAIWMGKHDTGLSSMAIALATLAGEVVTSAHPLDASDFGRCYRLLRCFPVAERGLTLLAKDGGPVWAELAVQWPRLTKLYEHIEANAESRPLMRSKREKLTPYTLACEHFRAALHRVFERARGGQKADAAPLDPEKLAADAVTEATHGG